MVRRARGRCEDGEVTENFAGLAQDEVVDICRDLIRIDTTNPGDHSGRGSGGPPSTWRGCSARSGCSRRCLNRTRSGPAWWPGSREATGAAPPSSSTGTWTWCRPTRATGRFDPFAGEIADGCVWGRGAVDMKDMDAMVLAAVRQRMREGRKPARDIVLAFTADEEAGGNWGAGVPRQGAPGPVRGRDRGDRRGRRVQRLRRRPAGVRGPDGGEGPRLDAAHRDRHRRARVHDPPRQRGHRDGGGGRPGRPAPVADPAPRRDHGLPHQGQPGARRSSSTRRTRPASSASSAA